MHAETTVARESSFGGIVGTVQRVHSVVLLHDDDEQAMVAICPDLQGRVLSSTARGWTGRSNGWVNQDLILSGKVQEHFNPYGGEDRLWLGPEGGQYSIFFAPGAPFDLEHWMTPAALDTEPFELVEQSQTEAKLHRSFHLRNYSGFEFHIRLDRIVRLIPARQTLAELTEVAAGDLRAVAFESQNVLINIGSAPWTKADGLLSIWVLGQFAASPATTIIVPFQSEREVEGGQPINTDYFGHIPDDRLSIGRNAAFFKADAQFRSKVGVSAKRSTGRLGSYDARRQMLTIVEYSKAAADSDYVNSAWRLQDNPYAGDVANCYNDGPEVPGGPQLGAFYELESSSPAAALSPGRFIEHVHRTIHLEGNTDLLDKAAAAALDVRLQQVVLQ